MYVFFFYQKNRDTLILLYVCNVEKKIILYKPIIYVNNNIGFNAKIHTGRILFLFSSRIYSGFGIRRIFYIRVLFLLIRIINIIWII